MPRPWVVHSAGEIRCRMNTCSSRQSVRKGRRNPGEASQRMQIFPWILRHDRIWGAGSGGGELRQVEGRAEVKDIQALLGKGELSGLPAPWDMSIRPLFRAPLPEGHQSYPSCTLSLGSGDRRVPSHSQVCSSGSDGNTGALRLAKFYSTIPSPIPHHPYYFLAILLQ